MLIEVVDDAPVPYYSYLGPDSDCSPVTWPECVATVQLSYGGGLSCAELYRAHRAYSVNVF